MWWRMASLGQLPVLRNWSSLLLLITPFTCCTTRRINYVYGSLVNINFFFAPCCRQPTSWPSIRSLFHLIYFSAPSFFSIYFLPLLPFSSASPLLRPHCLSRCLPKVALPNVEAPFVAIAQVVACRHVGRLSLGAAYDLQLSLNAVPMCRLPILVPSMLMDAVDHLLHVCLLALSWPLQVALLPSPHPSWSSLFLSFVLVCVPFSSISQKRWAKWDQPVAYCPAHPPKLVNSHHSFTQHTSATTFVFHLLPNFTSW